MSSRWDNIVIGVDMWPIMNLYFAHIITSNRHVIASRLLLSLETHRLLIDTSSLQCEAIQGFQLNFASDTRCDLSMRSVVVRELAHQWPGNLVTMNQLKSSHPIEVPIQLSSDIDQVFDAISYLKGNAVMSRIARSIGLETFTKGVSHYLQEHLRQWTH